MRKLIVVLASFGALLLPGMGYTLGLGEIQVNSALNQQLDARIELLSSSPEDAEALIVVLGSREEFARAGLDRPYELTGLKFKPFVEDGKVFIQIKTSKPVREPFLNFLIEVDWPKGHLIREYTILLDPPVFMGGGERSRGSSRPTMMDDDSSRPMPDRFSVPDQSSAYPRGWSSGSVPQTAQVVPAPIPPEYVSEPIPATALTTTTEPEPVYADEPIPESVFLAQQASSQPEPMQPPQAMDQGDQDLVTGEPERYAGLDKPKDWKPDKDYKIQKGDTLWSLAKRMRPNESVSIQQMMLAMLRTNPEIFINGNINGLKRGFILRLPPREDIGRESITEARALAQEHNALWRQYRQTLASDVPGSALDLEAGSVASAADDKKAAKSSKKVPPPPKQADVPKAGDARLSIVSVGEGEAGSGDASANEALLEELRAQLAIAQESLESSNVEKEELKSQVKTLEEQVNKMQSLLTIQDTELAKIQSLGKPGVDGAQPPAEKPPVVETQQVAEPEPAEPEQPVEEVMSEQAAMAALDELSDDEALKALNELNAQPEPVTGTEEPVEPVVEEMQEGDTAETTDTVEATETAPEVEVLTEPQPDDLQALDSPSAEVEFMDTAPQPRPEPGLIDALLNNKLIIALVLVLISIIAGGGYVIMKQFRKKGLTKEEAELRVDSTADELPLDMFDDDLPSDEALARAKAEDNFDADATTILPSAQDTTVLAPAADKAGDTVVKSPPPPKKKAPAEEEVRDDIIAEADVYLAYGIYQQAEELLENAVKEHPDMEAYRVKLAETYFASKNVEGMEKLGIETQKHVGVNDTPGWQKIVAMGKELCPEVDVFKNAGASHAELDMDEIAPKSPEPMDLDLGESADDSAGDLDFDLDLPDTPAADDSAALDMGDDLGDLGGDDLSLDSTATESAEDGLGDVEFDIGELGGDEVSVGAAEDDISGDLEMTADEGDLELDIDPGELEMAESAESDDLGGLDFDMSTDDSAEDISADLGDDLGADLDLSMDSGDDEASIEIDAGELDMPEEAPSAEADEESLDLSMDLGSADEATSFSSAADTSDVDLGEVDIDEINTKLDLARAYVDMGDHEGARDIIDEVLSGGTDDQRSQAQELLNEMA